MDLRKTGRFLAAGLCACGLLVGSLPQMGGRQIVSAKSLLFSPYIGETAQSDSADIKKALSSGIENTPFTENTEEKSLLYDLSEEDTKEAPSLSLLYETDAGGGEDDRQKENADALHAGVSSLMMKSLSPSVQLLAGVASPLYDYDSGEVYIVAQEKIKVAAALKEQSRLEAEAADRRITARMQDRITLWGYTNLGMADTDTALDIYREPSKDSRIVGRMLPSAGCEIVDVSDGWAQITSGEVEGYVPEESLLTGMDAYTAAVREVVKVASVHMEESKNLRVRAQPSTSAKILTNVHEADELIVLSEEEDGWVYASIDTTEGYVCADYLTISEKLVTAQKVELLSEYGISFTIGDQAGEVSQKRIDVVEEALSYVGNPYVYGGSSLTNGTDCSGFTMRILGMFGVSLPHHAASQPAYGKSISPSEARPGDLFFYGEGGSIEHVAIYIGSNKIVHASSEKTGIKVSNANYRDLICVASYFD